jgi:exo-1,4-beta-D-glucosaminidase
MTESRRRVCIALCVGLGLGLSAPREGAAAGGPVKGLRIELREGWRLQSSRKVQGTGEIISTRAFEPDGWYRVTLPSTVLAAQVAAGEFGDPFMGMNLRRIPGTSYPIGFNSFSSLPMPKDSPYAVSWWYRGEVQVPARFAGKRVWLSLGALNYRASIWINGKPVAGSEDIQGAYRIHELDVTSFVTPGAPNVIALETFAPTEKQLGINWVDWNPTPPDKNMGIWGDVALVASGPVTVRHSQVVTHFADPALHRADLTIMSELRNASDRPVAGVLEASVDGGPRLRQEVSLAAGESRRVELAPARFPALQIRSPRVWWPAEMGQPALHGLRVRFTTGGHPSDEQAVRFGIREVTSELTAEGYRLFKINGRRLLIRGAGWAQDMLLRRDRRRLEAQLEYAVDLGLNTIRLEAQLEEDAFFDLTDEKGLLVMAGWCCCDVWEQWKSWVPGTLDVAGEQLRTQLLRMRSHPSVIAWLNASDGPPPAPVETAYARIIAAVAWPNVVINSAADATTTVNGPSGVKMSGPYDYQPPAYWFTDQRGTQGKSQRLSNARFGGAYGFNTETSPGPAIPPLQSLKKFLPPDHLWPPDEFWSYHGPGERYQTMHQYRSAMDATYGKPEGLEDFLRKSQAMAYDGQRAMFEAHARNKYTATGVIQWMLNNGWPSTFWHLYDYYLYPAGGYFGTKKANEPLHVMYSYDDRSVAVINSRQQPAAGLTVVARAYDLALRELFSGQKAGVEAPADSTTRVLSVPALPASPVTFVRLSLRNGGGQEVSSNFYWLPQKGSTMDWVKTTDTSLAPIATFEDLTALARLPRVELSATATRQMKDGRERVTVTVRNAGTQLAFQVHLGVRATGAGEEALPVLWEDNYLPLFPGESRTLTAAYLPGTDLGRRPTVVVDGWNVQPLTVAVKDR